MSLWLIGIVGIMTLVATVVPGLRLYWPHRTDPVRRGDLGLALMTGALIAFSVLLLQLLFDLRLADADAQRIARAEQQSFLDSVSREENLAGVDFSGKDMHGFFLQGKDFSGANLHEADLSSADLRLTKLVGTDMRGAKLEKALLDSADLHEAKLQDVEAPDASFYFANLEGARLVRANLRGANFRIATARADFRGADLTGVDMYNADLAPSNLRGAILVGADLHFATLRGAHLEGADFRRAQLEGVDFSNARFDARTKWPRGFEHPPCKRKVCRFPETPASGARAPFPKRLTEIKRMFTKRANRPKGWKLLPDPFGVTVASPGEDAHLYVESTPLPTGYTAKDFADLYEQDFEDNYRGFRQYEFRPIELLGGIRGFARRYGYIEGGVYHIAIDLYYVEPKRGYLFIFTSDAAGWPFFQRPFRQLMRVVNVKPDLFPNLGPS